MDDAQILEDIVPADELMAPPYDGNVAILLRRSVDRHEEDLAVQHGGESLTYADFGDRVERIAGGLHDLGLEPGDRLCVYLPNGIEFCEIIWACIHAGVVASPINPEYRRRELEYQFENSDSKVVVTSGEGEEHAVPVAEEVGLAVVSTASDSEHTTLEELAERGEPTLVEREDDDTLLQPYTSGTTGEPKGVLLTHENFRVQIVDRVSSYSASLLRLLDADSLVVFPMYHITGMVQMTAALCSGQTFHVLRPDQWDPELVLDTLDEHNIPAFGGVATMFLDLLDTYKQDPDRWDLSTLLRAGQGGDKLPEPIHEEFEERFEVAVSEGYGLTETTAGTHTITSSTLGDKVGSIGQPLGHTDSKIIDPETGEEVPDGEEGELVLRGPQVMKGYYERPEANEAAFVDVPVSGTSGEAEVGTSAGRYFRTGDIASRDRHNYYYIKGREKDMILTAGYNVYPSEVEQVLYDHPAVHEAAVFGVPDERRGETVAAAVTLVEGADATAGEIKEYVLAEIAPYKHPRTVEVMDELPKTGSGKIRKVELREAFADREDAGV